MPVSQPNNSNKVTKGANVGTVKKHEEVKKIVGGTPCRSNVVSEDGIHPFLTMGF